MTFKYNVNGVGLDQIFEPYASGIKAALTGYTVNGVDLREFFAPISAGSSAAPTGYKVHGADLNTIFAAKGTVAYVVSPPGYDGASWTDTDYTLHGGHAQLSFSLAGNGTWSARDHNSSIIASGNWYGSTIVGIGSQYEAKITVTLGAAVAGGGTYTQDHATFASLSAGANVTMDVVFSGSAGGEKDQIYTVKVEIRKVGTTTVLSTGIFTVDLNAGSTGGG